MQLSELNDLQEAYALIGVELSAGPSEIRRRYRAVIRTCHPDKHPAGSDEQRDAERRTARLTVAYRQIKDAPLRFYRPQRTGSVTYDPISEEVIREGYRRQGAEDLLRFTIGAGLGLMLVSVLFLRGARGFALYAIALPLACGWMAMSDDGRLRPRLWLLGPLLMWLISALT
jgi:curved DNA-binding protein CbpA